MATKRGNLTGIVIRAPGTMATSAMAMALGKARKLHVSRCHEVMSCAPWLSARLGLQLVRRMKLENLES